MAIKYEAYTWDGQKVRGILDADSEEAAYERLQEDQLIPYRVQTVRRRRSLVQRAPFLFKPKPQEVIGFTQRTASLLSSGIPLRRALMVERDQSKNPGLKEALRQVVSEVEGGGRLSDAIARHPTVFAASYTRLMKVGEATGNIAYTLEQLAESLQRRKAVADKVKGALAYPVISLLLAAVAGLVLIKFSLPSLVKLLEEFHGELPLATRLVIAGSDFLQAYIAYVLLALVALILTAYVYVRTPPGARVRDTLMLKLPLIGNILVASNMFVLTSTFATMLKAGIPPVEALRLTGQGLANVTLREKLAAVTTEVSGGARLGEAFGQQPIFPELLVQGLTLGEVRGTQIDTLQGLASYYEQQTNRSVGLMMELIQPVFIIVIASVVGFVAVAVVSGIYSTLGSIK